MGSVERNHAKVGALIGPLFFWQPRRRPGKRFGGVRWGFRGPLLCGSASVDGRRAPAPAVGGHPAALPLRCSGSSGERGSGARSGPCPALFIGNRRQIGAVACAAPGAARAPLAVVSGGLSVPPGPQCGPCAARDAGAPAGARWSGGVVRSGGVAPAVVPGPLAVGPPGPGPPSAGPVSVRVGGAVCRAGAPPPGGQINWRRRGCSAPAGAGGGLCPPPAGGGPGIVHAVIRHSAPLLSPVRGFVGCPLRGRLLPGANSFVKGGLRYCNSFSYPL